MVGRLSEVLETTDPLLVRLPNNKLKEYGVTMWLYVAVGGAVGSVARYVVSGWAHKMLDPVTGVLFPWGTLTVNMIGCGIMGFLGVLVVDKGMMSPPMRTGVLVGMLGAFTTWSSFGIETIRMFHEGNFQLAAIYVAATNIGCLLVLWMVFRLAHKVLM